ncbi:MAG: PatB family C-S lyase [Paludibacteraceae bacterium]|nr:PatB family C-S lyase [Paludibacteraceae bacterium]
MSTYNFDKIIDRKGTRAFKYELLKPRFGQAGLLPFWVADMEFETPSFILDALQQRFNHPVYGYTVLPEGYFETIAQWVQTHHGWQVDTSWISFIPGVVRGVASVINCLTSPDDKIIIQPPVYHPFKNAIVGDGRTLVTNPLRETPDHGYTMDFEQLESVIDDRCKLLILSNPHNPAGIVWDAATLRRLAEICYKNGILVISDEIHCDLALWGNRHIPFASVSKEAAEISITFGAPTKTFNFAGLVSSYAIVPNEQLRRQFYTWLEANEYDASDIFGPIATMAAFTQGEPWRRELIAYIEDNVRYVEEYCHNNLQGICTWRPQASFLVWLDCRKLGLSHSDLIDLFVNRARLALNDGAMFGREGSGFMRLNVGCPRSLLTEGLDRIKTALATIKDK